MDTGDYSIASSMVEVADNSGKSYQVYDDEKNAKRQCTEVADEYDAIGKLV